MKKYYITAGICLSAFLFISLLIYLWGGNPSGFDLTIQKAVLSLRQEWLTVVFKVITYSANWQIITLFCIAFLFFQRTRKTLGTPLAVSALLSSAIYKLLKEVFLRARPAEALHLVSAGDSSFPSGHSMTGLVFYGLLFLIIKQDLKHTAASPLLLKGFDKVLLIFPLWIFLVGLSRLYLGVHWPTDIIGGWCLGLALLIFLRTFFFKSVERIS